MVINGKKHDGPIRRRKSGMDKPNGRTGRADVVVSRNGKPGLDQRTEVQADESDSAASSDRDKA